MSLVFVLFDSLLVADRMGNIQIFFLSDILEGVCEVSSKKSFKNGKNDQSLFGKMCKGLIIFYSNIFKTGR